MNFKYIEQPDNFENMRIALEVTATVAEWRKLIQGVVPDEFKNTAQAAIDMTARIARKVPNTIGMEVQHGIG